jgi:predicted acyltransferase
MAVSKTSRKNGKGQSGRLLSLDVFRGMTVAFMIIVNTPGTWSHVYAPLRHAPWHGCTPTDLVFPSFLFISGVAMWYSLRKYNFEFSGPSLFRILRRVALIFLAGLFLNIFPRFVRDYDTLRIMGVLQRIALAWGLGAIIVLLVKRNYIWVTTLVILLGYWALMYFFGGSDPYSLEGNFGRQVDMKILGENHLYKGFGVPFDPEGLLSTIPAVATVLLGFMTGNLISSFGTSWKTAGWLAIIGAALIGAGLLLGQYFPINKPIWTSSYVLYAGGIGMMILALLFIIVDIWGLKGWTGFFNTFGTNALFTYLLAGIWTKTMLNIKIGEVTLYNWIFTHICSPLFNEQKLASLLFAILQVLFIWAFGYILYRKKIIIRF